MVVGYDAERWQHFFGNGNYQGNQYLTSCPVTATFHQLTSAQDLETQIYTSALITHETWDATKRVTHVHTSTGVKHLSPGM